MHFSVVFQLAVLGTAAAQGLIINSTTSSTTPSQTGGPIVGCATQYNQCVAGGGNNCAILQDQCVDSCYASLQQCNIAKGVACQVDYAACAGSGTIPSPAPTGVIASCSQRYLQCQTGGSASCDTIQTECLNQCYDSLQQCSAAGGAACQVDYAACAGNPIINPGSTSTSTVSPVPTASSCTAQQSQCEASGGTNCAAQASQCVAKCEGIGYTCEMIHGPNCQASYAACVGPAFISSANGTTSTTSTQMNSNGGTTSTQMNGNGGTTTTQVVEILTTVCPPSSTISVNGQTWTAGSVPLTITVTNCPCTLTSVVSPTGMGSTTGMGSPTTTTNSPATSTQTVVPFTGAAVPNSVMGGSLGVVVVGAIAVLL